MRKNVGKPFIVLFTILWLSLLFILMGGCGQITGGASGASACTGSATSLSLTVPISLYVTRTSSNEQWAPPLDRCVTDAEAVQHLYAAAYALPLPPPGNKLVSCPAGPDLVYNLTFLHGTKQVQQMTLQMTGCQFLHIGKTDGRDITPSFLSLFAQTSGISPLVPNP